MQCPACAHPNEDGASFCSNCGKGLAGTCGICSAVNAPGSSFCSNCGNALQRAQAAPDDGLTRYVPAELLAKLEAARAGRTMAGERRTVTMLFADIQGSTAAAEQLDPEEWAEVVNGAFEHLIRPVYRYEGTLARLMGDAVLAFFGAPIAHEDDPERAVMAGLEMLREAKPYAHEVKARWGIGFDLRVGINTGLVVVGEVGSDLRVEYSALGDAVNVAARMEQTALPGTLQVSGDTQRLVDRLFEFEELEPVEAKGKAEPVSAFRVTGVRERPATVRGLIGRATPLVGREPELAKLHDVIAAVRQGKGQICSIIGDAGVGKSRLAAALRADLEAENCLAPWKADETRGDSVRWAEARCLSYNTSVAYAPFVDLFSGLFGIQADDDPSAARAKVAANVDDVALADPRTATTYLCALLGVQPTDGDASMIGGMSAPDLQRSIFSAVLSYMEACARSRPSVLVIEDLHWADAVSLSLLEALTEAIDRSMLAIIALMRPHRGDPSWSFHEAAGRDFSHRYTPLELRPLDDDASRRIVDNLLGGKGIPEELQATIWSRAEGNPFFVEEIIRVLLEAGTLREATNGWVVDGDPGRVAIPGGVAGLLTARLDRLDEYSKLVTQLASVLGREFEFGELAALAGGRADSATEAALTDLMRRDLMVEKSRIPRRVFAFRHALIQETAYDTILLKERRSLHGEVADHLIENGAAPHEIAHHLLESRQEHRAIPHLIAAGDEASRAMSLADAIRFYDGALSWASNTDDVELVQRIHEGLGAAYTLIPDLTRASASYQQMLAIGRSRSEPSVQITALNRLGFTSAFLGGDYDQATTHLEEARRLAESSGDSMGLAEYHMNSCMIATTRGDLEKAAAHDAETSRIGSEVGSGMLAAGGALQRALSLAHATRYEEGLRALEKARELAAGSSHPQVLSKLAAVSFFYLTREGKLDEAWEQARIGAEMAHRAGSSTASVAALEAGMAADQVGDIETALAYHAKSLRLGEESGQLFNAAASAASMARIYTELGDREQAASLGEMALGFLETPMGETLASTVYAELAAAALAANDLERAAKLLATGIAGSSASKFLETPRLLLGLAAVRTAAGDVVGADALLEEASVFVEERQMAHYGPAIAATRGEWLLAQDRNAEAAEAFAVGVTAAKEIGAASAEWRLRAARAGALGRYGELEAADMETATAHRLVDDQADRIVDDSIREAFRSTASIRLSELARTT